LSALLIRFSGGPSTTLRADEDEKKVGIGHRQEASRKAPGPGGSRTQWRIGEGSVVVDKDQNNKGDRFGFNASIGGEEN